MFRIKIDEVSADSPARKGTSRIYPLVLGAIRLLLGSARMRYMCNAECPIWPIFWPEPVKHFERVLECEGSIRPSARTQGPGTPLPLSLSLQPGAPLFAIRACSLLAVLAQWLCGQFWTHSRTSGAGRGLVPTAHVPAIKRRKGPCSRGPLFLPALSEIPRSRCYSNWTHFQRVRVDWKEEGILTAARLRSLFKWWIMRLNIFESVRFQHTDTGLILHYRNFLCLWVILFETNWFSFLLIQAKLCQWGDVILLLFQ